MTQALSEKNPHLHHTKTLLETPHLTPHTTTQALSEKNPEEMTMSEAIALGIPGAGKPRVKV